MTVAIVDYGSGNLHSAAKAFERVADAPVLVTDDPDAVARADRIVLPGVGAFGDCRRGLAAVDGMIEALEQAVIGDAKPFLGICVGMQLMASEGLEHGRHKGFGWIAGTVAPVEPAEPSLKVPHMGWNDLQFTGRHPVLDRLPAERDMYFVHSYHVQCDRAADTLATVDYGGPVTAVIGRDNMIGTQFHPEKSQKTGLAFIAAFLEWRP